MISRYRYYIIQNATKAKTYSFMLYILFTSIHSEPCRLVSLFLTAIRNFFTSIDFSREVGHGASACIKTVHSSHIIHHIFFTMDPFNEVEADCWTQVNALEHFIRLIRQVNENSKLDYSNNYQELMETLEDLNQAVVISESNPSHFSLTLSEIVNRKQILAQLQQKLASLDSEWADRVNNPHRPREVTTMSNRISEDDGQNPFSDSQRINQEFNLFQQQELMLSQDLQLDLIHQTMQNLNQQATMMGGELEEQGFMLEDLDQEMDTVGNKLQRGLKRVNFVIEKNRETASNWCIGILVVALCILLVLLIAV